MQLDKCDAKLGHEIEMMLREKGINTPMNDSVQLTDEEKIRRIREAMQTVMETLGLDMTDDSLIDTPNRVAKMLVRETMWGLKPELFPKCTAIENKMQYNEMVCEKDVKIMSNCEHHLVTIDGKATIAYIPNGKVLGLSKMNRIANYFARRPQVQERLTVQIAEALKYILGTEDVAVVIDAKHYCVKARGVEDTGSSTITTHLSGAFMNDPAVRAEFMAYTRG